MRLWDIQKENFIVISLEDKGGEKNEILANIFGHHIHYYILLR